MNNYMGSKKNGYQFYCIFRIITMLIIVTFLITGNVKSVKAEMFLTQEEQTYLSQANLIIAASIDGGAPLHYTDSKGEIKGIAVSVLKEIADMTGLIFEYRLYPSIEDAFNSDADIFFGLARKYAPSDMVLSQPYLKSETVLFYNSSLDSNKLEEKRYADIEGGDLPDGIKEENTIYYNNREDTLSAVNSGEADYGYGNAYSVAFYMIQNGYKNIVTIPKGKESREYCIGFAHENATLLSIINKSIEAIEEQRMQSIVLDMASSIDRRITPAMVLETYTKEIFIVILQVVAVLLFFVTLNINSNKRLELQNKRYENLSKMSNEYLFEYSTKTDELMFSEKSVSLLGIEKQSGNVKKELRDVLFDRRKEGTVSTVKLPLANGEIGVFRIIKSNVYDAKNRLHSIIGKL
ncbi:MAG: transporter substrate-binding domain-containing protein, partial [Bacteroidales bacterium]|nr:transporter substrate-binding domain-containing protein [Bacteroidales bacterium]